MRNLIKQYNISKVIKEIGSLEGINIMIDDVWIEGAQSVGIEYIPIDDEIPEDERDGSEENFIRITLNILEGRVSVSFCPEREVCEVWHETEDLLIFKIQGTNKYIEHEKDRLEFMQKEYDEYMTR